MAKKKVTEAEVVETVGAATEASKAIDREALNLKIAAMPRAEREKYFADLHEIEMEKMKKQGEEMAKLARKRIEDGR